MPSGLKIGLFNDIRLEIFKKDMINIFILGILFMTFIYHLILWLFRMKDVENIFFSSFCFNIIIRIITINYYFSRFFINYNPYELSIKLEFLTAIIGLFLFLYFLYNLFPDYFLKKILNIFLIICISFVLFYLVAPCWIYNQSIYLIQIVIILGCLWGIFSVINAFLNKVKYSGIILSGIIIVSIAVLNDIFYINIASFSISLIHFGLVIFIMMQSSVLSLRFSQAYQTVEHLSTNLQKEVNEKTKKINKQNRQLKKINQEKTDFFISLNLLYAFLYKPVY